MQETLKQRREPIRDLVLRLRREIAREVLEKHEKSVALWLWANPADPEVVAVRRDESCPPLIG